MAVTTLSSMEQQSSDRNFTTNIPESLKIDLRPGRILDNRSMLYSKKCCEERLVTAFLRRSPDFS